MAKEAQVTHVQIKTMTKYKEQLTMDADTHVTHLRHDCYTEGSESILEECVDGL